MVDETTLKFYRSSAEAYAGREITSRKVRLTAFLALLAPNAVILELGCGAGGDTAEMLARGFDVPANVLDSTRLGRECNWEPRVSFEQGLVPMWQDIRARHEA